MFLIAQTKRFGTLNATQNNRSSLQSTVLEKNQEKLPKNSQKCIFLFVKNDQLLAVFLDTFKNCAL